MNGSQPGILAPIPSHCRYLEFGLAPDLDPAPGLRNLASRAGSGSVVVGLGPSPIKRLGRDIAGLHGFAGLSGPGCEAPSTQADLWLWLRGADRGRIAHLARALDSAAGPAFRRQRVVDGFKFDRGLDLTGYEDGTENPKDGAAVEAAIVQGAGSGLDGSSFVSVQQWAHDLDRFERMSRQEQDNSVGRRLADNAELKEAPISAHIKRTAQESFDPPAFVLRRSMPWADAGGEGLMFVAFGRSLQAFEAQLRRMTGQEDGVADALFRFSRPISGSHFWCPPVKDGKLSLAALGL